MIDINKTLYILNDNTYLHVDHDSFLIECDDQKTRVPVNLIEQIIIFGSTSISDYFIRFCSENNIFVSYVSFYGKYYGGLRGKFKNSNIFLRQKQYRLYEDNSFRTSFSKNVVLGKILNQYGTLLYAAKNTDEENNVKLVYAAGQLKTSLAQLKESETIEEIRGVEGKASSTYFGVFDNMLKTSNKEMLFIKRSKRPPENNCNALLSFLYTLLNLNCIAALESFGLDSFLGYMHTLKPGRESLANDLIEEFRSPVVDRFVVTLINRKQIKPDDFEHKGTSIYLKEASRKKVLLLWEEDRNKTVFFPLYKRNAPKKLLPYLQAQLLAQYIRGDISEYPPYIWEEQ